MSVAAPIREIDRERARKLAQSRESAARKREREIATGERAGVRRCSACGERGHYAKTCSELPDDQAEALAEAARLLAAAEEAFRRGGLEGRAVFRARAGSEGGGS